MLQSMGSQRVGYDSVAEQQTGSEKGRNLTKVGKWLSRI